MTFGTSPRASISPSKERAFSHCRALPQALIALVKVTTSGFSPRFCKLTMMARACSHFLDLAQTLSAPLKCFRLASGCASKRAVAFRQSAPQFLISCIRSWFCGDADTRPASAAGLGSPHLKHWAFEANTFARQAGQVQSPGRLSDRCCPALPPLGAPSACIATWRA